MATAKFDKNHVKVQKMQSCKEYKLACHTPFAQVWCQIAFLELLLAKTMQKMGVLLSKMPILDFAPASGPFGARKIFPRAPPRNPNPTPPP
jgi:hypothetical protein